MRGTYLQNKKALYNWVEKNRDKHNANQMKSYFRRRDWKNIKKEFLLILLN